MHHTQITLPEINHHPDHIEISPFRHIVVNDFFKPDFYEQLCSAFQQVRKRGYSEAFDMGRLSPFPGYDAYFWLFPPGCSYPLDFFYSAAWRDYFSQLFDIPLTNDIVAEFHSHSVNSAPGFVHNDYNYCCFTKNPLHNGINPWYYQCRYDPRDNDMESGLVKSKIRSIAIIYYLCNEPWHPGDGGETGLFLDYTDAEAVLKVPPLNNSLFAFEISPQSYHGFLSNVNLERNSLIMWFHTENEIKMARHNHAAPVSYGEN